MLCQIHWRQKQYYTNDWTNSICFSMKTIRHGVSIEEHVNFTEERDSNEESDKVKKTLIVLLIIFAMIIAFWIVIRQFQTSNHCFHWFIYSRSVYCCFLNIFAGLYPWFIRKSKEKWKIVGVLPPLAGKIFKMPRWDFWSELFPSVALNVVCHK